MTEVLRQAFALAYAPFHILGDMYDRAGFFCWRALMDDKFLALDPAHYSSPIFQEGIKLYDWAKVRAQASMFNDLSLKGASGDVGPKPDIKPNLMNMAQSSIPFLSRMPLNSPAFIGAVFIASLAVAWSATHGGPGHAVPDLVSTVYGASPHTPRPKND